jgi:hypothetical protein
MTVYVWSALSNEAVLAFNPSADKLNFDSSAITAAAVGFNALNSTQSLFTYGGKTVTLQTAPATLTPTNVYFASGGRLLVGDGTKGTANDAGNNVIDGGAADDQLQGLAGNDTLRGHGGADLLAGGPGNDALSGGSGIDTAVFSGRFADYSLSGSIAAGCSLTVTDANGSVGGDDGTDVLTGIERLQFSDASVDLRTAIAGAFKFAGTLTGDQYQPSVTSLTDGGFIATWQRYLEDGAGWGIYAQRHDATGAKVGGEFQVNTTVMGEQYQPIVTALAKGAFVVTWVSDGEDGSGLGIYGQRYDATGAAAGSAFRVNSTAVDDQYQPSVTMLVSGGFVVTWQSYLQDGSGWGIYGQRYDAAGAKSGGEFKVNTEVMGDQFHPSVTALADGGFAVTWLSLDGTGAGTGLCGQRYDAAGAPNGGEVPVDNDAAHSGYLPFALADGGFLVVSLSYLPDGTGRDIHGQLHGAGGAPVGGAFKINTTAADSDEQPWPSVTALVDGGFVVTWCSVAQDGSGLDIHAQRYTTSGAPAGSELAINVTAADGQEQPGVAPLADGGFLVTWMSCPDGNSERGILGQRFGADGAKIGLEMSIAATGNATDQSFAGTPGDDFLDGRGGFDNATFSGPVVSYHFAENGAQVSVSGPDGTDTLANIEQLNFANLSFSIADRSHFDPLYYLNQNPDVAAAAVDPLAHYRFAGWAEGRDPSASVHLASIDGLEYIASYGDLIGAFGLNKAAGYQHFATAGLFEGRIISFDGLEYIASYGDLINAFGANADAGASHYITQGRFEGRTTTFDGLEYIASYGDLIAAFGVNGDAGASHYIYVGHNEGRHVSFDGLQYIASYGDLINAFHTQVAATPDPDIGSNHYIAAGYAEHRAADLFDASQYLANYADLQAAFGSNTEAATVHYITNGYFEHRTDHPLA